MRDIFCQFRGSLKSAAADAETPIEAITKIAGRGRPRRLQYSSGIPLVCTVSNEDAEPG